MYYFQVGLLKPIFNGLTAQGMDAENIFYQAGLRAVSLDNARAHLPMPLLDRLVKDIQWRNGIEDIGLLLQDELHFSNVSADATSMCIAYDLMHAIELARTSFVAMLTNSRIGYQIKGDVAWCSRQYVDYARRPRDWLDQLSFVMTLNAMRIYLGDQWEPYELHFQCEKMESLDKIFPHMENTRVRFNQPTNAYSFATADLFRGVNKNANPGLQLDANDAPQSHAQCVAGILNTLKLGTTASLSLVADMMGVSERTLRRLLQEEGATFSKILEDHRFKCALTYLSEGSMRIKDVSQALGYGHTSNFERAFKRWTNQTPMQYLDNKTREKPCIRLLAAS